MRAKFAPDPTAGSKMLSFKFISLCIHIVLLTFLFIYMYLFQFLLLLFADDAYTFPIPGTIKFDCIVLYRIVQCHDGSTCLLSTGSFSSVAG